MRFRHDDARPERSFHYRPDVDGLRAVAIVAVMLYHCGIPGFSGGFGGVDVFFVISGYLITGQILREREQGTFSLLEFWARRARRIVPALAVVTATCLVTGWFLFFPVNYRDLGRSAVAASGFASNVFFWFKAGYFTAPAETKPLLHTWSVSIEEQFYLVIPIVLSAVAGLGRRGIAAVIVSGLVASLMISGRDSFVDPDAAFYLLPARGWELLAGCLLAAVPQRVGASRNRLGREMLAAGGLAAVIGSTCGIAAGMPWPVPGALAPCLGASAIIHAGGGSRGPGDATLVTRWLSSPPLVGIGLISYSLYLWHWPLLAFTRYAATDALSPAAASCAVAAAVPMAWLSYRFVELPARRSAVAQRPTIVLPAAGAVLTLIAAAGLVVSGTGGMPGRPGFDVRGLSLDRAVVPGRGDRCQPVVSVPEVAAAVCRLGEVSNDGPKILLVGDSFADMYHDVFAQLSARHGREVWFMRQSHAPVRTGVANVVRTGVVSDVVLAFSWRRALEGGIPEYSGPADAEAKSAWARSLGYAPADLWGDRRRRFRDEFGDAVKHLASLGARVHVVDSPPSYPVPVPLKLAIIARRGGNPERFGALRADHDRLLRDVHSVFAVHEQDGTIAVIRPADLLCDAAGACRTCVEGRSLYGDEAHLSRDGAEFVSGCLEEIFTH